MSPKQQQMAIAEACGKLAPGFTAESLGGFRSLLPDYPNDLNAMHEAEKVLDTPHKRIRYAEELGRIWTGHKDRAIPDWWFIHDATAAQRAEAFLRTLNLWKP